MVSLGGLSSRLSVPVILLLSTATVGDLLLPPQPSLLARALLDRWGSEYGATLDGWCSKKECCFKVIKKWGSSHKTRLVIGTANLNCYFSNASSEGW